MSSAHSSRLPWEDAVARGELAVVLVRHGRTQWNAERRFLGRTDIPLDAVGQAQAYALALSMPAFTHVYSSPLSRALETARALHPEPVAIHGLEELSQGHLEGLHREEAVARHPEFFAQWLQDPVAARVPGGETLQEVADRALRALQGVVRRHKGGEVIAVVTHQMVIATLLCGISDTPLSLWRTRAVDNASLTILAWDGSHLRVERHNWVPDSSRGA